jgi:helix-turn-helix protein
MSEGEEKVMDTRGKFLKVVQDGRKLNDANWIPGRVILSNKRVVVAAENGKLTIPLSEIADIGGRYDVNQTVASVSNYVSLRHDNDVVLFTFKNTEGFKWALYEAILGGEIVLAKHPAVEGGVVQDTDWEKARLSVQTGTVGVAVASGSFVEIDHADIGGVRLEERTVSGDERPVVEVEHTEGPTSVETHLAATQRRGELLESLLREGARQHEVEVDLGADEQQVLMALYSGVSPFEIPDFVGLEVDEVEEIYERLIELEILDEVRQRREVTLTTRGRNLASESINDE